MASLDHAMWFHRPFRADEWLLYVQDSPTASRARGLARGLIFTRDGRTGRVGGAGGAHPGPALSGSARRGPGACLIAAALLAACTIQTTEETETTTPPTTAAPVATTTIPPELRPPGLADVSVALSELARYDVPLTTIRLRPGSESIFVGDPNGRVYEIKRDPKRNLEGGYTTYSIRPQTAPFADISAQVTGESEGDGMHGFAFSTDGSRLYLAFTDRDNRLVVSEFRVTGGRVSPTSQREVLAAERRSGVRHAGPVGVGTDGFLWVPMGDDERDGSAQDPENLAGAVVRIDPETGGENPYNVPLGNPYRGGGGRPEVYLLGLRDPKGLWFDPVTRDTWMADTGADGTQEITRIPWEGAAPEGGNFGWPIMNGDETYDGGEAPADHLAPTVVYGSDQGCGVVAGATYHAGSIPGLDGAYVYGDACTSALVAITVADEDDVGAGDAGGAGAIDEFRILPVSLPADSLVAIGTDPQGELIVVTTDGSQWIVHQLVYVPPPVDPAAPPPG